MDIKQSVQEILTRQEIVTDLFYIKYLDRYPELRHYFEGVEMPHQAVLLKMALTMVQQYYEHRFPTAKQYLLVLGHKHHLRQVPKAQYADWRDCLLDTLQQSLPDDWSAALEREWTDAINLAIDVMHDGYRDDFLEEQTDQLRRRSGA